jgi:hypothetical protein
MDRWKRRTLEESRDAATRWRDAETNKKQDGIFKETGYAGPSFFASRIGTPLVSLPLTACITFSSGWRSFSSGI